MTFQIEFSDLAVEDLVNLLMFSWERWGESQPELYAAEITRALDLLASFPSLGRSREELRPGCRAMTVESHVIYYEIDDAVAFILRILHQRERPSGAFDEVARR